MSEFNFSFHGRETGAIGIFYFIDATITAENLSAAYRELYQRYDHVHFLRLDGRRIERPDWNGDKS
jgi:hypothetical protein